MGRPARGKAVIHLDDLCYVRLGTRDRVGALRFARDVLGLEPVRDESGATYLRSDAREHTLVYCDGDPREHTVGFALRDLGELDAAAAALSNAGHGVRAGDAAACEQRRVAAFVNFRDPSGNSVDLVVGLEADAAQPATAADMGLAGFSHVGLCSIDASRDERFWTGVFDARVSDRIGVAALLRIDSVHHKLALFPAARPGVQHINHQMACIDDVMRAWYRLREQGVRVVFGPGRHPTSGAVFVYFAGPDSMVYEYSAGVRLIGADEEAGYRPRQFQFAKESFCMWGAVPDIGEFSATD
jgi:2,3-dihydroxy-p-cumate/2,3-dihydroxybenzoate 3,4-dioxygenase